jgi:hypothetical protein
LAGAIGLNEGGGVDVTGDTTRGLASTLAASSESPLAFRGKEEPNKRALEWDRLDGTPAFEPSFLFYLLKVCDALEISKYKLSVRVF